MSSLICFSALVKSALMAFNEAWQFLVTGPPERLLLEGLLHEALLLLNRLLNRDAGAFAGEREEVVDEGHSELRVFAKQAVAVATGRFYLENETGPPVRAYSAMRIASMVSLLLR